MPNSISSPAVRNRRISHNKPKATTIPSVSFAFRDALRAAPRAQLPIRQRAVLAVLANRARPEAGCWPSWELLADETGASRTVVWRQLNWLEARGFIYRVRCNGAIRARSGCRHGREGGAHYHLNYAHMAQVLEALPKRNRQQANALQGLKLAAAIQTAKIPAAELSPRRFILKLREQPHDVSKPTPTTFHRVDLNSQRGTHKLESSLRSTPEDTVTGEYSSDSEPLAGNPRLPAYRSMDDYRADSRGWGIR